MDDFQTFLDNTLKTQQASIQAYKLDTGKVWLKKHLNVMVYGYIRH